MLGEGKSLFVTGVEPRFDGMQCSTVQSVHHLHHLCLFSCKQWRDVHVNVTLGRVRVTSVAAEKQKRVSYSECVSLVLVTQHATRMRHIVILWPVRVCHIFPLYLINGTILGEKLQNTKCVFWFPLRLLSETFLILRRIQRGIIIIVCYILFM